MKTSPSEICKRLEQDVRQRGKPGCKQPEHGPDFADVPLADRHVRRKSESSGSGPLKRSELLLHVVASSHHAARLGRQGVKGHHDLRQPRPAQSCGKGRITREGETVRDEYDLEPDLTLQASNHLLKGRMLGRLAPG